MIALAPIVSFTLVQIDASYSLIYPGAWFASRRYYTTAATPRLLHASCHAIPIGQDIADFFYQDDCLCVS